MLLRTVAAAVLGLILPVCCGGGEVANVTVYPVPDAADDCPYYVMAAGKAVPIEKACHVEEIYCARFQFDNPVTVTVGCKSPAKVDFVLKPRRFRTGFDFTSGDISFEVTEPGPRVITPTAGGRKLPTIIVVAERPDTYELREPVIDVADYLSASGLQTEGINKALRDCAERGGGTVYFGPGVYRTGTINVPDNTTLFLAPGSLIIGSDNVEDYPAERNGRQVILFNNCSNSGIRGRGVVDGNGHVLRNQKGHKAHLVDVIGCRNITIQDVVFRNSAAWALHILGCDDVTVDNLKIINDWGVFSTDGIDPDCSTDVSITNYFGHTGDDAIAVKTTLRGGVDGPTRNVAVKDSVVMTKKTALKLGTESRRNISNVVFENIDVINSSRGMALWMYDGAEFSDVVYRDIRLDLHEFEGEPHSGEPVLIAIGDRQGVGTVDGVLFENIDCEAPYRSILIGKPESMLKNITFRDCTFRITDRTIKKDVQPAMDIYHADHLTFDKVNFIWNTSLREFWEDDFIRLQDCKNVTTRPYP